MKAAWKAGLLLSAVIGCISAFTADANAEITISRDQYGVPLIEGNTNKEMFFGYGYVMARDRILQITKFKLLSSGIAPNNPKNLQEQRKVQVGYGNFYLNEYPNLDLQIAYEINSLQVDNPNDRLALEALHCIAEGINRFLFDAGIGGRVQRSCFNEREPSARGQHLLFGESITPHEIAYIHKFFRANPMPFSVQWTAADILKIFQNRVMDEFSNRNEEINSLEFLRLLEDANRGNPERARRIFNSFKWVADPDALTEIQVQSRFSGRINEQAAKQLMSEYRISIQGQFLRRGSTGSCPAVSSARDFSAKSSGNRLQKMAHLEGSHKMPVISGPQRVILIKTVLRR
ncbi:MAG: penicillin acylase family protein, partial [Sneathiella sp.]|nr:penicillin acylase family protein [Sneathiella sp.]